MITICSNPKKTPALALATADCVATRALTLSAVSCRALIEKDAHKPGAEKMRKEVLDWLGRIRIARELESAEFDLLSTPLGALDSKRCVRESWKAEGMVVLAWGAVVRERPAGSR
jgi:hypothetical protein